MEELKRQRNEGRQRKKARKRKESAETAEIRARKEQRKATKEKGDECQCYPPQSTPHFVFLFSHFLFSPFLLIMITS